MRELKTLTAEEFDAINDPQPGTDPAWDSLTESEKRCLRQPQLEMGKSLSDLLRDREALAMPAPTLKLN